MRIATLKTEIRIIFSMFISIDKTAIQRERFLLLTFSDLLRAGGWNAANCDALNQHRSGGRRCHPDIAIRRRFPVPRTPWHAAAWATSTGGAPGDLSGSLGMLDCVVLRSHALYAMQLIVAWNQFVHRAFSAIRERHDETLDYHQRDFARWIIANGTCWPR